MISPKVSCAGCGRDTPADVHAGPDSARYGRGVGNGLILLVFVGVWLVVLVPMALRSHDHATSLRSADRFSDAMRVLARRPGGRDVLVPRRGTEPVLSATRTPRRVVVLDAEPAVVLTPAQRRLRLLLILLGAVVVTLGGALLTPVLLGVHVVADLLLVAFVVHLRRQAVLRVQLARRAPVRWRDRVTGIPDRMPRRPVPLRAPLPAPAARYEDRPLSTGTWSPVPVPLPSYVGKAAAVAAPTRRVLDLTRPGRWSAEVDDVGLELLDDGPELDEILDRQRAVNGW